MSCNKPLCSSKTDDDDPLALLASLGVGIGETWAADPAPAALSDSPLRPQSKLRLRRSWPQTHKASELVVFQRTLGRA